MLYRSLRSVRTKLNNATAMRAMRNIVCQSLLRPESISSAKIRVNIGTAMVTQAVSSPKTSVSQNALEAPRMCFFT